MSDEENHLTVLTTLYDNVRREITRYRDYEWQITASVGGLFVWVITMLLNDKLVGTGSSYCIKLLCVFLLLGLYAFGFGSLCYVHTRLNSRRNLRTKIEHILFVHEPKRYLPDNFSIPEGWDKTDFDRIFEESRGQKIRGFLEGWRALFVIAFIAFLSILVSYAIFIIWEK